VYSERTAREIDLEVRRILDEATEEVRSILSGRREALEAVAQLLVEKEVIDGDDLRQLLLEHSPGPKLVPGTSLRDKRGFSDKSPAAFVEDPAPTEPRPLPDLRAEGGAGANSG
jgi:hypothetical protein